VTDTNVFALVQPGTFTDRLTDVLRDGARALLARTVEAEVAGFLAEHADKRTDDGRQRLVRHGHLPERSIMTGIGAVEVRVPRVRDRLGFPSADIQKSVKAIKKASELARKAFESGRVSQRPARRCLTTSSAVGTAATP
jgi:Transposase, Mutator family